MSNDDSTAGERVDAASDGGAEPLLAITASRQFTSWLAEQRASLAFTTYQAGKLFFVGLKPDGRLSIFERTFNRCMGMWASRQTLFMSSLFELYRFENALAPGQSHDGYDALYVPQAGYYTGDLDIHDLAPDGDGRLVFANTLFSCLATVSERHSFVPLWQPPFITRLAAEDRCHLNGLAMREGRPRYVTTVARSDVTDGWRDRRADGGLVIDVATNEILAEGLSMPHSPRFYRDRLWLLESGSGYFGYLDEGGAFQRVAFCPGYLRGLGFAGGYAVVGHSKSRQNRTFSGLELDDNLTAKDAEPRCGLTVIDLRSGDAVHWVRIEGVVMELYDVCVIEDVVRPMAIGFKSEEIRRTVTIGEPAAL